MADVVVFYGPPFVGKTKHYIEKYSSYERVSAQETFQYDSSLGLRHIILHIVKLLRSGKKVVIDDENWSDLTRKSYIKSISDKIPSCQFKCVKFCPSERLQVFWAREWALAERTLTDPNSTSSPRAVPSPVNMCQTDAKFEKWFCGNISSFQGQLPVPPLDVDGLQVEEVETNLCTTVKYKFELPALFVQWEGMLDLNDDHLTIVHGITYTFNTWYKANPGGRVIIINDRCNNNFISDSPSENRMKQVLSKLCADFLDFPVYFCCVDDSTECGNFAVPPQPGLVAWLQRMHHLQLNHPGTLYLTFTSRHIQCAISAGVNHMKARDVFSHPNIITASNCANKTSELEILKTAKFAPNIDVSDEVITVPLYQDGAMAKENFYQTHCDGGRCHGICFKDKDALQKYNEQYCRYATPITEVGSRFDSLRQRCQVPEKTLNITTKESVRSIPKWLLPKSKEQCQLGANAIEHDGISELPMDQGNSASSTSPRKLSRMYSQPMTLYCMNELELVNAARIILQENAMTSEKSRQTEQADQNALKIAREAHPVAHQNTVDTMMKESDGLVSRDKPTTTDLTKDSDAENNPIVTCVSAAYKHRPSKDCQLLDSESETGGIVNKSHRSSNMNIIIPNSEQIEEMSPTTPKKQKMTGPDLSFLDDIF